MKIVLLSPAGAMHRYSGSFKRGLHYAPLTLTTLAALVPEELSAEVVIYDETAGVIPLDLEADIIGITAITGTSERAYRYADYFRSKGITVVMGGTHPSIMPGEAKKHADSVVVGLGDESFPKLLRDFAKRELQPYYFQSEDVALKGRPVPRRELLNPRKYITMNSVEVIRGCLMPCTFCAYPAAFGKKLYRRDLNEVMAEIEKLPGKDVLFPDVNLIADRDFAKEFFSALIPLKKRWFGLATSNIGEDEEMIRLFEKSGCSGVLIGFESVNEDSQKYIHKGVNKVGSYDNLVKRLHNAGIAINGCFAFGGDEDGPDVFKRTVEEVERLKIDLPRYSILTPFPGTPYYKELDNQNRIFEKNWAMYDVEHVVFNPLNMTPQQLYAGTEWAWRETYSVSSILNRIGRFESYLGINLIVNTAYRHYADKFVKFTRDVMTDNSDIPLEV